MQYNPFVESLRDLDGEVERLERERVDHGDELAWAATFPLAEETDEIARLRSDLDQRGAALADLEADLADTEGALQRLGPERPAVESRARLGSRASRLLTSDYKSTKERLAAIRALPADYERAKSDLATHKQEMQRLRKHLQVATQDRESLSGEIADLTDALTNRERAVDRFQAFAADDANRAIADIDENLVTLKAKRAPIAARSKEVQSAVEEPLTEWSRIEAEISKHQSEISDAKTERSRLGNQIQSAEDIADRLNRESDGYKRKKLHEKCEREFGDGRPHKAINSIRSTMRRVETSIDYHERQVVRLGRAATKIEARITALAAIAAREIDALIIDGNNCCYDSDGFIGLAALIPITERLAETYPTTVIFDASIRRLLKTIDQGIRVKLPKAKIHVVASGTRADETILDAASSPTTWVISNDRYSEFGEKGPVSDGRVIRHEILKDRVLVHGLGVNEPLVDPDRNSEDSLA